MARGSSTSYAIILRTLIDSRKWNACSWPAQGLYVRLLLKCDDAGLYHGGHYMIAGKLFAQKFGEVSPQELEAWLGELGELIRLYEVDGERYLEVAGHKTVLRSDRRPQIRFPAPPGGYRINPRTDAKHDPTAGTWAEIEGRWTDGRDTGARWCPIGIPVPGAPLVANPAPAIPSPSPSPSPSPERDRAREGWDPGGVPVGSQTGDREDSAPLEKPDQQKPQEPAGAKRVSTVRRPAKGRKLKPLDCEQAWRVVSGVMGHDRVASLHGLWVEWWEEARMKGKAPKSSLGTWGRRAEEWQELGLGRFRFLLQRGRLAGWQALEWSYVAKDWEKGEDAEDEGGILPPWLRKDADSGGAR